MNNMKQWSKIKITVIEMHVMDDLVKEFVPDDQKEGYGVCGVFKKGQEFILEELGMPKGFCSWAWADIHREVIAIMAGASLPFINREGTAVVCCTDAIRPVVFKIERI